MTDAELVREAAEKVMGWKPPGLHSSLRKVADGLSMQSDGRVFKHDQTGEWSPLANDSDALMLVDKLASGGREFTLEYTPMLEFKEYGWYANFDDTGIARDPDRRRAIVLAALRAVGVEAGGKG